MADCLCGVDHKTSECNGRAKCVDDACKWVHIAPKRPESGLNDRFGEGICSPNVTQVIEFCVIGVQKLGKTLRVPSCLMQKTLSKLLSM